jgi:hypothetical protein
MRTVLIVGALVIAAANACYSPDMPTHTPTKNPLDEIEGGRTPDPVAKPVDTSTPPDVEAKKHPFDDEQAKIALVRAAKNAHQCMEIADKTSPKGDPKVTVTFSAAGKSIKASIPAPFEGTNIGDCAVRAFVGIIVSPFSGDDVARDQDVDLTPDPPKVDPKASKKK